MILSQANARTHTPNFMFGTGESRGDNLCHRGSDGDPVRGDFGDRPDKVWGETLFLTGANTGLKGTITINQGAIDGNALGFNFRP